MSKRATIAIDIDDVLSASAEGFVAFSNERWGHSLVADDYQEEWAIVWGTDHEETFARADEFHASGVIATYRHNEQALPVLQKLHKRFDLVLVTSRRQIVKPETDQWVERHFPGIFKDLHYVGMWDREDHPHDIKLKMETGLKATKTEICRQIGASYLIDDQLKHCVDAAAGGIQALLFGNYRWNKADVLPAGVTRVESWKEVEEYFDGKD